MLSPGIMHGHSRLRSFKRSFPPVLRSARPSVGQVQTVDELNLANVAGSRHKLEHGPVHNEIFEVGLQEFFRANTRDIFGS
jgi:hypothetical protein